MFNKLQDTIQTLIRNWLRGDSIARESLTHKTANDADPFLKDAIDGYESIEGNHLERLNRLDDRLEERIGSKKKNRVVFLMQRAAAIAAILLMVLGSFWWYDNQFSDEIIVSDNIEIPQNTGIELDSTIPEDIEISSELVAENEPNELKDENAINQIALAEKKKDVVIKKQKNTPPSVSKVTKKKEIEPVRVIVENTKKVTEPEIIIETEPIEASMVVIAEEVNEPIIEVLSDEPQPETYSDAPDVVYQEETEYASAYPIESVEVAASIPDVMATIAISDSAFIKGIVYDTENEPIFGASIVELGTENGTITDFDGQFELPLKTTNSQIQVSYIGFKDIVLTPNIDSMYSFVLEESEEVLEAVIVSDYSSIERDSVIQYLDTDISVYPKDGYEQFYKYLDKELLYPQSAIAKQVEGVVRLRFEIDENGHPQNVEIQESVGFGCDEEAVRLLKEGPIWQTKEGENVTNLSIPFKLETSENKVKTKPETGGN